LGKKNQKNKVESKIGANNSNVGDILKVNAGKNNITLKNIEISVVNRGKTYSEEKEDEILRTIFIPGRMTVDNKKIATIKFDDGRKEKYRVNEIILSVAERAEMHIDRFYSTFAAYTALYIKKDETSEENIKNYEDYQEIDELINLLYDEHNENKDESDAERQFGILGLYDSLVANDFVTSVYLWNYLRNMARYLSNPEEIKDYIDNLQTIAKNCLFKIDDEELSTKLLHRYIHDAIDCNSEASELLRSEYRISKLNDDEVLYLIMHMLGKEGIKTYLMQYGVDLVERKNVVRQLIDKNMITEEEFQDAIGERQALVSYLTTGNKEFLKYICAEDLAFLYYDKKIDMKLLTKYSTLEKILLSELDKNVKFSILCSEGTTNIYGKSNSALIWELFEKDYFSCEEIKELERRKYINSDSIIVNYLKCHTRKIATELGVEPSISDEKILEFFTPDTIVQNLRHDLNGEKKEFLASNLRKIYSNAGKNYEQEIVNSIMQEKSNKENDKYLECIQLFKKGIISENALILANLPEEMIVNELLSSEDNEMIIRLFNNGLISQNTVVDLLGENFDEAAFELIKNGMSAKVIEGFYSARELIENTRTTTNEDGEEIPPKLSFEDLAEIKEDIQTGLKSLIDMYTSGELKYNELYRLAEVEVISEEEANQINERYNLSKDVEKLKLKGISGQPLENVFRPQQLPITSDNNNNKKPRQNYNTSKGSFGFDSKYIVEFYKKMGANDVIQIDADKCPIFEGYSIIPIIDKKIGFLEGADGRTYILPLKIILEQINNPGSQMDLIGIATSRNDFNGNKKYVRSTNHTKNWVENTIKKAVELSPIMTEKDAKNFKNDNIALVIAVRDSYERRRIQKSI